ncbi:MAG: MFS transporter [Moraxellaceae bacterium]|jgi:PAT family beta-lactamase induction signal transducer AmpG|nr:MFS transporter [Moraxellaceae bacterium]MBP7229650.1 MFS transporter [Moraxellaceae bacterium]MBP8852599.1 MFS transporter [Moraxellaceae bacterium]MBP9046209.1 MFS transporter [Moraxellaceae bacterium]MBP9730992.1 MFS transporter [Moraxellaceae bacterium]
MNQSPPSLREAFAQPAALTMFFFGFTSGLPFLLVGGTLSAWLKDSGVSLEDIGLMSLAGLAYSVKFLWSPAVDRVRLPLLGKLLGQRRSWLLLAQIVLALSLLLMSMITPQGPALFFVGIIVIAAFAGATQDVVVDAYRIEIAPEEVQGALAATYTLGYRIALLGSGAFALILADHLPWPTVYQVMALAVIGVMLVTVLAREPEQTKVMVRATSIAQAIEDSMIGPFRDFFRRYSGWLGIGLLVFIGLFKISDQMLGVMALPFYLDSGFTKTEIGAISKLFGVWVGIAGAFLGGAVVVRLGIQKTLLIAMILGGVSNLLYLLLSVNHGNLVIFTAVIGGENLAGGFLGTAAVAWLSSLVNREYTATQYALFSSLVTLPGKLIGGVSGFMVTSMGYEGFFIFSTVAVLPALALFFWLQPRLAERKD